MPISRIVNFRNLDGWRIATAHTNPRGHSPKSVNLRSKGIANDYFGNANGLARTALRMRPLRMHCVQTRIVRTSPLGSEALMACRFGKKRRRVMPVILVPTPPKYLALPRVSIILPT